MQPGAFPPAPPTAAQRLAEQCRLYVRHEVRPPAYYAHGVEIPPWLDYGASGEFQFRDDNAGVIRWAAVEATSVNDYYAGRSFWGSDGDQRRFLAEVANAVETVIRQALRACGPRDVDLFRQEIAPDSRSWVAGVRDGAIETTVKLIRPQFIQSVGLQRIDPRMVGAAPNGGAYVGEAEWLREVIRGATATMAAAPRFTGRMFVTELYAFMGDTGGLRALTNTVGRLMQVRLARDGYLSGPEYIDRSVAEGIAIRIGGPVRQLHEQFLAFAADRAKQLADVPLQLGPSIDPVLRGFRHDGQRLGQEASNDMHDLVLLPRPRLQGSTIS